MNKFILLFLALVGLALCPAGAEDSDKAKKEAQAEESKPKKEAAESKAKKEKKKEKASKEKKTDDAKGEGESKGEDKGK